MNGRPGTDEAATYYFTYIDAVSGDNALAAIERQSSEAAKFLATISEEKSLARYAPEKWSIRQVLNHVTDTERAFVFRALWFARGFAEPLPGFDQDVAAAGINSDAIPWATHIEEFRDVRQATIALFRNMPAEAWGRRGIASGNPFTVRALAFIIAGHVEHHIRVLRERYL
jgi:DinB superfamily